MTDAELTAIIDRQRRRKTSLAVPHCTQTVLDDIDALLYEVGRLRLIARTASEDIHHGRHRDAVRTLATGS